MARLNETFTTDDLPEDTGGNFDPLPAGEYTVEIEDAEVKETQAKTGEYIKLKMRVHGPTHMGRIIFGNLNIKNPSAQAEQIGRGQLGSILRAMGIAALEDTDQLIGGQLNVRLKVTTREGYPPGNEVQGYKAADGGSPAPTPTPRAAAPARQVPAPAAAKKAPWAK